MSLCSIVVVIFCMLLLLFEVAKKERIFAPTFLLPLMWGILILGYNIIPHGMYSLSGRFHGAILLWIFSFYLGASIFRRIIIFHSVGYAPFSRKVLDVYYKIVLCTIPFMIYAIYTLGNSGSFSFFANIRLAAIGMSDGIMGWTAYISTLALVTFWIELYQYNGRKNKVRLIILLLVNVLSIMATMAKTSLFLLCVGSFVILGMKHGRIKIRSIVIGSVVLLLSFSVLQLSRELNHVDSGGFVITNMINVYFLGGMPAFDALMQENIHSDLFGANTLSFFYKLLYPFIGINVEDFQGHFIGDGDGYALVPYPTNVFTVLAPFYRDFSFYGIFIFGFIKGGLAGVVYRVAKQGIGWGVIVYAYIVCSILLEFFSDFIFLMLSQTLQIFLMAYIAYRFTWKKAIVV